MNLLSGLYRPEVHKIFGEIREVIMRELRCEDEDVKMRRRGNWDGRGGFLAKLWYFISQM